MTTPDDTSTTSPPDAEASHSRRRLVRAGAAVPFVLTLGTGAARAATSITCDTKPASQHPGDTNDWPSELDYKLNGYQIESQTEVLGTDYVELKKGESQGTAWYRDTGNGYTLAVENDQLITPSCDNSFVGMR